MRQAVSESFINQLRRELSADVVSQISPAYLQEPRGQFKGQQGSLLLPRSTEQVSTIVKRCNQHSIGIVPYAGGTGLVGGQIYTQGPAVIVLSVERMSAIRNVDLTENTMLVEAGAILTDVQACAAEHDRLFPLSLASEGSCRIGGNLATNAGGVQVLRYGNTRELCLGIEAVMPDGSVYNGLKHLKKDNTGYDLRNLLIGSEGTLAVITAATLKLFVRPEKQATAFVALSSPSAALTLLEKVQHKTNGLVSAFELVHRQSFEFLREALPDVRLPFSDYPEWMVLIEVGGGSNMEIEHNLTSCLERAYEEGLVDDVVIAQNQRQQEEFWNVRESIPEANRLIGTLSSHDISVPMSEIPAFITATNAAIMRLGAFRINCFGHLGDGNLHYNVFPPRGKSSAECVDTRAAIQETVYDIVFQFGGSFSAEHGIGRLKIAELQKYADPTKLAVMQAIKSAIDPNGIMNPGAVVSSGAVNAG